jgi:hypothetical protein
MLIMFAVSRRQERPCHYEPVAGVVTRASQTSGYQSATISRKMASFWLHPDQPAIVGLKMPNVQQCLLPRHSQFSSQRRMIHAALSTMLIAAAALMPGAEAAGVRHLLQGFSSEKFETATNNDGSQSSSGGGTSPTSSKTHSTQSSEVACSSKAKSFTIADSKDVHVRAGMPCARFGRASVAVNIKKN